MRNRCALAGAAALAAFGLTACGSGDQKPSVIVPTNTPPQTSSSASARSTSPTASASAGSASPTPKDRIVYDRSSDSDLEFVTPSGNLHCAIYPTDANPKKGSLRCDVLQASWKLPPRPAGCDLDWGKVLTLARSARAGACVGDAVDIQGAITVKYGTGVRWHNITCYSEKAGLQCLNTDNQAGFTVSRERYTIT